ncbi:MAG TPA: sulfite exporter TauE/SafE family protein [Burkholderiales bacterium]|nr:sulfite exporter TauE/SafE family protein [Burkholderiales bacterium]
MSGAELGGVAWWWWPLGLFALSFAFGVVAVIGGVGGGVLFVPLVSGFFPFHIDFVRGAGLMLALSGSLAATPSLLRGGLASLRLALPLALVGSVGSIAGALLGFALPADVVQTALGATILGIVVLMWLGSKADRPRVGRPDRIAAALRLHGLYHDPATKEDVDWRVHRTPLALLAFAGIGLLAGMFGLGAGWANVPVLNLLMGAPLKLSVGTSAFLLTVIDTSAAWIYLHRGAILPMLVAPTVIGVMLGARIGARLLRVAPSGVVRRVVIAILFVSGLRALLKGLGIWV